MANQDMHAARVDLTRRVATLEESGHGPDLAGEVDAIRAIARAAGMLPAVTVAHALGSVLANGERGALVAGWLALLKDAVGSERQDRGASDIFGAACTVRLSI